MRRERWGVVVEVPEPGELARAVDYLRDRVIGVIPAVLMRIIDQVEAGRDDERERDVDAAGHDQESTVIATGGKDARFGPSVEHAVRDLLAVETSARERALRRREEGRAAYRLVHAERTRELYEEWLDEQARQFAAARDAWFQIRRARLNAEHDIAPLRLEDFEA